MLRKNFKLLIINKRKCKKYYSFKGHPITGLHKPVGLKEFEAPRVFRHHYMKVVKLSALLIGRL